MTNSESLAEFAAYLKQKNRAPLTIIAYLSEMRRFLRWWKRSPRLVTRKDLDGYVRDLIAQGNSPRTIGRKFSALGVYYKFLNYTDQMTSNPTEAVELPKQIKKEVKPLSKAQVDVLRGWPVLTLEDDCDRLVVELFYSTGARRGDLAYAKRKDYSPEDGTLRVIGKGRKEARLIIRGRAKEHLDAYLAKVPVSTHLLNDLEGSPLGRNRVYECVKRLAAKALPGVRVYPHLLRHSIITHRHDRGEELRDLQKFARHSSPATTADYAAVSMQRQVETYDKFDPDAPKP